MTEPVHLVRKSTRHRDATAEGVPPPNHLRLGRRESEPHSIELTYLYDVLRTNYPECRAMWDLHHYFKLEDSKIDLQFDVSFFTNLSIPYDLPSYKSDKFGGKVPMLAINILSKSTYNNDLGVIREQCRELGIPVYVIFNPYLPTPQILKAPYLKVHYLESSDKFYRTTMLREYCTEEGREEIDLSKTIDISALPFKFGIKKLKTKYDGEFPRFRLILIDKKTNELLLTREEIALQNAEEAQRRAEEAQQRAEEAQQRAEEAQQRAEEALRQVDDERKAKEEALRRAESAEQELKKFRQSEK